MLLFCVFQSILYDELTRFVLRLTFSEVISKVIYKDGCFLTLKKSTLPIL